MVWCQKPLLNSMSGRGLAVLHCWALLTGCFFGPCSLLCSCPSAPACPCVSHLPHFWYFVTSLKGNLSLCFTIFFHIRAEGWRVKGKHVSFILLTVFLSYFPHGPILYTSYLPAGHPVPFGHYLGVWVRPCKLRAQSYKTAPPQIPFAGMGFPHHSRKVAELLEGTEPEPGARQRGVRRPHFPADEWPRPVSASITIGASPFNLLSVVMSKCLFTVLALVWLSVFIPGALMRYDLILCVSWHWFVVKSWRRGSYKSLARLYPKLEFLIIFVII